jgi:RNA-binding protein
MGTFLSKRLGTVENFAVNGTVLIRADLAPPLGTGVVDAKGQAVGTVVRVFGPVRRPYLSVEPAGKPSLSLLGKEVYPAQGMPYGKKGRGSRGSH